MLHQFDCGDAGELTVQTYNECTKTDVENDKSHRQISLTFTFNGQSFSVSESHTASLSETYRMADIMLTRDKYALEMTVAEKIMHACDITLHKGRDEFRHSNNGEIYLHFNGCVYDSGIHDRDAAKSFIDSTLVNYIGCFARMMRGENQTRKMINC